jgi:putative salt-induced outer membrane protein YdiY
MKTTINSFICATAFFAGVAAANAQAPAATPAPVKTWETTAAAGLSLTRGNSHTILTTLGLDSKRKWEKDEALVGISGGYGKSEGIRNTDFVQAYGQWNHLLDDRWYYGARLDGNHDGISRLSYRFRLSPLFGYYIVKNDKTSLSVETGPSVVLEKFENLPSDTYIAVRFGEKFEHKLSDTAKIWQTAEYIPQVDRWVEKYLINGEVGISSAINKQWDMRVVAQVLHDSEPAPGRKYNDFRLIAGTGYKF